MELKPSIQDYTRDEFTTLVHTLWHGNIQQEDHDKLIDHFDSIVEHPDGADLIFHAKTSVSGISPSVDGVVYMLELQTRLQRGACCRTSCLAQTNERNSFCGRAR
jgi:light-regulated signal transduction histidine kinase (bacteriophytochrome)